MNELIFYPDYYKIVQRDKDDLIVRSLNNDKIRDTFKIKFNRTYRD